METKHLPSIFLAGSLIAITPRALLAEIRSMNADYSDGTVFVEWDSTGWESVLSGYQVKISSSGCPQEILQWVLSDNGFNSGSFYCGYAEPGTSIRITASDFDNSKSTSITVPGDTASPCMPSSVNVRFSYDPWTVRLRATWSANPSLCQYEQLYFAMRCGRDSQEHRWSAYVGSRISEYSCDRVAGFYLDTQVTLLVAGAEEYTWQDPFNSGGAANVFIPPYEYGTIQGSVAVVDEWSDVS